MDATTEEPGPGVGAPLPAATWRGRFEPFLVGDPGRAAARVVPVPDPDGWDRRDTVLDGIALREGRRTLAEVRAASVRGLSHRAYGTVRQDEYAFRRTTDGRYFVIGVADGVSSGRHSHRAAVLAARWGVANLAAALSSVGPERFPWGRLLAAVADRIEQRGRDLLRDLGEADAHARSTREIADHLATTVLYAVIDLAPARGAHEAHLVAVGDTSAWVLRPGGCWEPRTAVKNGNAVLASSAVRALPLPPPTEPVPVRTRVGPGEALVLMTDGVGDPLGAGDGDVGRYLAEVWSAPPPTGLEFAAQVGFARKSFDDDRTAVAFWPIGEPGGS
ncbi:protein phosphatase 2C domain-containing protein [Saccharothrix syringae]|uniref:PPM-type phosphatase domain-containing protein n=1 Tax=Saccharothrix syringae TaxID=103733 RepID=A0A5Q0GSU9_SACSY|nr:protein phosphatase 2C domain-containing protein [Saccharothrix syringae]QFZ16993.1 hypothetical protein EKG83_05495 [Saccharothrix syringae]